MSRKKKVGRKKKEVKPKTTEEVISELARYGATNSEIAEYLDMDDSTLARNYKKFITKGRIELKKRLRLIQIQVAEGGNAAMLIWLGKVILGQREGEIEIGDYEFIVKRKVIK